jgi:hypothetical protein
MSTYFGPLDKSACVYFFIIALIFFIALVFVFISELLFLVQNYNKLNLRMISATVLVLFNLFLAYFFNRLLYGMCTRSLA